MKLIISYKSPFRQERDVIATIELPQPVEDEIMTNHNAAIAPTLQFELATSEIFGMIQIPARERPAK